MKTPFMVKIIIILLSPICFIIMPPIEYPLWKEYKIQGYSVPGYVKFFWRRCIMLKDDNYKKEN